MSIEVNAEYDSSNRRTVFVRYTPSPVASSDPARRPEGRRLFWVQMT